MTDYIRLNPSQSGWLAKAKEAIDAKKPIELFVEQETFFQIVKAVYERAEQNPFKDIMDKVKDIPGVPPPVAGMIQHTLPFMGAVASMTGAPAAATMCLGGVVGYAALHGYETETGVDWHKLFDFTDNEAYIRLDPK